MRRFRNFIIAVAALTLVAAPAFAQEEAAQAAPQAGKFLKCLTILGLSDQQKADIRQILETEKPVLQGLVQTLRTDGQALKTLLQATPPDACAIGNALIKVHADRVAVKAELEKIKANVEALLTLEQKAKLEGCMKALHNASSEAIFDGPVDGLDGPS